MKQELIGSPGGKRLPTAGNDKTMHQRRKLQADAGFGCWYGVGKDVIGLNERVIATIGLDAVAAFQGVLQSLVGPVEGRAGGDHRIRHDRHFGRFSHGETVPLETVAPASPAFRNRAPVSPPPLKKATRRWPGLTAPNTRIGNAERLAVAPCEPKIRPPTLRPFTRSARHLELFPETTAPLAGADRGREETGFFHSAGFTPAAHDRPDGLRARTGGAG